MCGCGQPTKLAPQSNTKRGWVRGEPMPFLQGHNRRPTTEDAFRQRFVAGPPDQCWEWQGSRDEHGYGYLRSIRAHRLSFELHCGPIPDGMGVLHRCDNRACVNPAHLFLGTQEDNNLDMVSKGRHMHGERVPGHKLSSKDVPTIRRLYAAGGSSYSSLSLLFGVSKSAIQDIVERKTWKQVE